jgi:holo-[acyl-carrier protein] synthase
MADGRSRAALDHSPLAIGHMLRTGVDLIEIARIERTLSRFGERFLKRCFTAHESESSGRRPESLAARFAAKEAVMKVLGRGITEVDWREIEVISGHNRQPELRLHGGALHLAHTLGLREWSLSLSHTRELAIAFVVALGETAFTD